MANLKETTVDGKLTATSLETGNVTSSGKVTSSSLSTGGISAKSVSATGKISAATIDTDSALCDTVTVQGNVSPGLKMDKNVNSNVHMTDANGVLREVIRVNNSTSTPILIIGDGFYVDSTGYTNLCGGNSVNLRVAGNSTYGVQLVHNSSMRYFAPLDSSNVYLGISSNKWKSIHCATATIQTSDEREKNGIMAISDYPAMFSRAGGSNVFEMLFSKLVPKTYYLNIEDNKPELHIGFVAQDVAAILEELGMSEDELGLLQHDYWTDEETGEEKDAYGLRYEEFIALNVYVTQKLIAEKDDMKRRLDRIEEALGISE